MGNILQMTFSVAISYIEFQLNFHWNLFLMIQLTISHHGFRWWLVTRRTWAFLLIFLCDACVFHKLIVAQWHHLMSQIWSTLVQVRARCLIVLSHYLNQSGLVISKVLWYSSEGNFTRDTTVISKLNKFEVFFLKCSFESPRGQAN